MDADWLLKQLQAFSDFYNTKTKIYHPEFAVEFIGHMLENHIVLIAERESVGNVGFIAGAMSPHAFNPYINVLYETFWWVDPAYRGSRAGFMLLNEFTEIGKKSADWISFSLEIHSPVNDNVLLKRGFRLQERNFLMEVT